MELGRETKGGTRQNWTGLHMAKHGGDGSKNIVPCYENQLK